MSGLDQMRGLGPVAGYHVERTQEAPERTIAAVAMRALLAVQERDGATLGALLRGVFAGDGATLSAHLGAWFDDLKDQPPGGGIPTPTAAAAGGEVVEAEPLAGDDPADLAHAVEVLEERWPKIKPSAAEVETFEACAPAEEATPEPAKATKRGTYDPEAGTYEPAAEATPEPAKEAPKAPKGPPAELLTELSARFLKCKNRTAKSSRRVCIACGQPIKKGEVYREKRVRGKPAEHVHRACLAEDILRAAGQEGEPGNV